MDSKLNAQARSYAQRADLYACIGDLLCAQPDERNIAALASAMQLEPQTPADLVSARGHLLHALKTAPSIDLETSVIADSVTVGLRPLFQIAMQADRCAHALDEDRCGEALEAQAAAQTLLRGTGGARICQLAHELERLDCVFYSGIGAALRDLLRADFEAIDAHEEKSPKLATHWVDVGVRTIKSGDGSRVLEEIVTCPQRDCVVGLDACMSCGNWDGMQFSGAQGRSFILCRK